MSAQAAAAGAGVFAAGHSPISASWHGIEKALAANGFAPDRNCGQADGATQHPA